MDEDKEYFNGSILAGYQHFSSWVNDKISGSYTYYFSQDHALEYEFATGKKQLDVNSVELGDLTEYRYSLLWKYFLKNSFHVSFGTYFNQLDFEVGENVRDVDGNAIDEEIKVMTYGLSVGIGNRWQWDNGFTLGVDWVRVNQPVGDYSENTSVSKRLSEEDQDDLKKVGRMFRNMPTFMYLGISAGYSY